MDYKQVELDRETIFKDSVLTAAEARGMQIVADAGKRSEQELKLARLQCEEAGHDLVSQRYIRQAEREFSSATQAARRDLLKYRAQLVDGVFEKVEENLAAFTEGADYKAWLLARLARHAGAPAGGEAPTVYLREADMRFAPDVEKALPGCTVRETDTILLGGLKLGAGHCLYDETLDAMLEAEREAFYNTGELMVK